ncbi:MAG: hypothetical protein M3680_22830 [Myxococcota bacterium]|nr:hypothetical protein [Myxococcota bacterium]
MKRLAGRPRTSSIWRSSKGETRTRAPPNSAAIDMSPSTLRRRLEELRALYKLMVYLRTAKPVDPA